MTPSAVASSAEEAIRRDGEIGLMQFLSARDGVELRSADLPEAQEFKQLLDRYPPSTLLVFLTGQRLLTGLRTEDEAASAYPSFYSEYLAPHGIVGSPSWLNWEGFKTLYRGVMREEYSPERFDADRFSPIRDLGPLNRISRYAHGLRDIQVLATLREGLQTHDRVMLVFGAWHILAIESLLIEVTRDACRPR